MHDHRRCSFVIYLQDDNHVIINSTDTQRSSTITETHLPHQTPPIRGPAMLEHVLDHVVPVLVLNEHGEGVFDLLKDHLLLLIDAVLQDALNHTASVCVHR